MTSDSPILPSDHPLAGCEAKFWRAHENFDTLQNAITQEFSSGEAQQFSTWAKLEPTANDLYRYTLSVSEVFHPSLRYATIIGDIVHNLRSALDHLVFELSFLGLRGKAIPGRVAFPVSTTRQNWNSAYVQNTLLGGVMKKHRAMLYQAQPCYRKQDSASAGAVAKRLRHPLSDLDNLWKTDKHRMTQPVAIAPLHSAFRIHGLHNCEVVGTPVLNPGFFGERLEVDTDILTMTIRLTGPDPNVKVQLKGEGEIGFRNGLPAREALAKIGDWVKSVIARFEPEFDTPGARRLWGLPRGGWIEQSPFRRVKEVRFTTGS